MYAVIYTFWRDEMSDEIHCPWKKQIQKIHAKIRTKASLETRAQCLNVNYALIKWRRWNVVQEKVDELENHLAIFLIPSVAFHMDTYDK